MRLLPNGCMRDVVDQVPLVDLGHLASGKRRKGAKGVKRENLVCLVYLESGKRAKGAKGSNPFKTSMR